MEQAKNEIKKAVVKKDRLNVVYNERFSEANYTNVINKSCDQIIHSDLREAFIRLRLHLVVLCEQPEASNINKDSFSSPGYAETLENYIITGYANDSVDGVSGITIMGSKLLQSGKVVDLKIFVPLLDEQYPYYEELSIDAAACDAEVESYLFEEYCVYQILSKYLEICNQSSVFISFIRSIMELLQEKITRRVVISSIYGKKQND